jgi:hypothetical protein
MPAPRHRPASRIEKIIEKIKANFARRAKSGKPHMTLPGPPALKLKTQLGGLCHPRNFFYCSSGDGTLC